MRKRVVICMARCNLLIQRSVCFMTLFLSSRLYPTQVRSATRIFPLRVYLLLTIFLSTPQALISFSIASIHFFLRPTTSQISLYSDFTYLLDYIFSVCPNHRYTYIPSCMFIPNSIQSRRTAHSPF